MQQPPGPLGGPVEGGEEAIAGGVELPVWSRFSGTPSVSSSSLGTVVRRICMVCSTVIFGVTAFPILGTDRVVMRRC